MEKETMDMSSLGVLLNLDDILILIRILEEPENSLLKALDFLGFVPLQMSILLGLKQNLQGIRKLTTRNELRFWKDGAQSINDR